MLIDGTTVLARLAAAASELAQAHPRVLIGLDGPDAAGKTTLADGLAELIDEPVVRASIDGFHLPREIRHRRGAASAEGYYRDSFDYPTLRGQCLEPFLDGHPSIGTTAYDYRTESDRHEVVVDVPPRAVLVFDGVFLLRPELRDVWTFSVYLRVTPAETLRRAATRDLELFGSTAEIEWRYTARYLPGQELYRREADPETNADVVIDNDRVDAPSIIRWGRW